MNAEKRRAGRRIRKTRRQFREGGKAFTAMGTAASLAAAQFGVFIGRFNELFEKNKETGLHE